MASGQAARTETLGPNQYSPRVPKIASILIVALVATLCVTASAGAASALSGKSKNKYGTVRLSFKSDGTVRLTLSTKLARRRAGWVISCRPASGDYETVVGLAGVRPGRRVLRAPARAPSGTRVCRVRQNDKRSVATMRMRR